MALFSFRERAVILFLRVSSLPLSRSYVLLLISSHGLLLYVQTFLKAISFFYLVLWFFVCSYSADSLAYRFWNDAVDSSDGIAASDILARSRASSKRFIPLLLGRGAINRISSKFADHEGLVSRGRIRRHLCNRISSFFTTGISILAPFVALRLTLFLLTASTTFLNDVWLLDWSRASFAFSTVCQSGPLFCDWLRAFELQAVLPWAWSCSYRLSLWCDLDMSFASCLISLSP